MIRLNQLPYIPIHCLLTAQNNARSSRPPVHRRAQRAVRRFAGRGVVALVAYVRPSLECRPVGPPPGMRSVRAHAEFNRFARSDCPRLPNRRGRSRASSCPLRSSSIRSVFANVQDGRRDASCRNAGCISGYLGGFYRVAVIVSGAHGFVTRRLLRNVTQRASRRL